jgi:hypothetical protein
MTRPDRAGGDQLWRLLALDRQRITNVIRRPTLVVLVAAALPLLVLVSALWTLGRLGALSVEGPSGGLTLGLLISGPIGFMTYGTLFGGADDAFLRHLGVDSRAFFLERCLRLTGAGLGTVVALLIPFVAAGVAFVRPAVIGLGVAAITIGAAALAFAAAARATATGDAGWLSAGIRQFDPGLAKAAPLVYAPLIPFLSGAVFGGLSGAIDPSSHGLTWLATAMAGALGATGAFVGAVVFEAAAPRFLPQAREMAYAPPPEGEGEVFRVGRGLSALLPRRSAAVWVRDATVGSRRFAWASRVTWPVGIVAIVALARWGDRPATQVWVLTAVGLALVVQAAAVVGLGRLERGRLRWIDRSGGLAWWERYIGRWAWAWGLSLWLLIPVGLAWAWWSEIEGAWLWPVVGAVMATVATGASLLSAERSI